MGMAAASCSSSFFRSVIAPSCSYHHAWNSLPITPSLHPLPPLPSRLLRTLTNALSRHLHAPPRAGGLNQAPARRQHDGDWKYSPEWWGTQGRGWGDGEGVLVFEEASGRGNGVVSVTAHPASTPKPEEWTAIQNQLKERQALHLKPGDCWDLKILGCDWRVLRFNDVTRQSVANVLVVQKDSKSKEVFLLQNPSCLAFEYLKSAVSVGLATVSCAGLNLKSVAKGASRMRILCIGLGGGSLPLFLADKLQSCSVEVVEIDKTVISAAVDAMGFPPCVFPTSEQVCMHLSTLSSRSSSKCLHSQQSRMTSAKPQPSSGATENADSGMYSLWGGLMERIKVFEADGMAYVCGMLQKEDFKQTSYHYYDLVFVDAFDGNDEVPYHLWNKNGDFLKALQSLLHPNHGTVVVNLHTDMLPPSLLERVTRKFGPGFDPLLPGGRQIQEISCAYRDVLLPLPPKDAVDHLKSGGVAFTVAVPCQQNIALVVCRGVKLTNISIVEHLKEEASCIEEVLEVPFDMLQRVSRGFQIVK